LGSDNASTTDGEKEDLFERGEQNEFQLGDDQQVDYLKMKPLAEEEG